MCTRFAALFVVLLTTGVSAESGGQAAVRRRPNVILIMTDDQGIGDFGLAGNPVIRTPNLDRMGTQGVRMTRFYVSPVCTPTRACLMTGRYNYRTRAVDTYVGRAMMEPAEVTVSEVLRDAGYATGIFGKWHLGDNYPLRAMDQGFAESLVIRGGGIGQPSDPPGGEGRYTNPILFHNGQATQAHGYCTDVYFDAAGEWIRKNAQAQQPFFAYIATNAPHSPYNDIPQAAYERYKAMDLSVVLPAELKGPKLAEASDTLARIYAMVENIDDNVGRLMGRLAEWGIRDDTLVLFLTDNGPARRCYVGPLQGTKSEVYEGGIRTQCFMQWPAKFKPGSACDTLAAHIDLMPTILEACGVEVPSGDRLDGRSLLPLLLGKAVDWPERMLVLQSHRGDVPVAGHNFAAVTQRWKLLNPSGFGREEPAGPPKLELYDLTADSAEKNNQAAAHPEIVARLKQAYDAWFQEVSSTRSDNYAPPRIFIGTPHENPVVLTRQNWRRARGEQLGYGTSGKWLLHVKHAGNYQMRLCFARPASAAGEARINFGALARTMALDAGATQCTFTDVPLEAGDAELQAAQAIASKSEGALYVEITGP